MNLALWPRRCPIPRDLAAVTTRSAADLAVTDRDLARLGTSRAGVEAVWSAALSLYRAGLHPALALCIRRRGEVVLDRAVGHARGGGPDDPPDGPRVLATPATPFCIFSASKAITALVVHHLDQVGALHIDDRVAHYVPEFARHGKAETTIRHVLSHRAGIPTAAMSDPDALLDWDRVVRLLCDARPASTPGRKLAYHAITGGFVLGEVVRRATGHDLRHWLREAFTGPLGIADALDYGAPPARHADVARNAFTGRPPAFPLSLIVQRALGVSLAQAVEISNDPRWLGAVVPSGNIVATADAVCRLYAALLEQGRPGAVQVTDPRVIARACTESSYLQLDSTLGLPVRYGLGMVLGAPVLSPFGPGTPRAFGHMGFMHIMTWADPDRALAAALLDTGKPFVGLHLRHVWGVLSAISRAFPTTG